jgi:hypothetical protein
VGRRALLAQGPAPSLFSCHATPVTLHPHQAVTASGGMWQSPSNVCSTRPPRATGYPLRCTPYMFTVPVPDRVSACCRALHSMRL